MTITVVVPTYQEADNAWTVLRAVRGVLPDAEIVVGDDNGFQIEPGCRLTGSEPRTAGRYLADRTTPL